MASIIREKTIHKMRRIRVGARTIFDAVISELFSKERTKRSMTEGASEEGMMVAVAVAVAVMVIAAIAVVTAGKKMPRAADCGRKSSAC